MIADDAFFVHFLCNDVLPPT